MTAKPKPEMSRVTTRLPRKLWDEVQHRAIDEHIPLADLIAKALTQYLQKAGKQ
jgi:hypothetical protein